MAPSGFIASEHRPVPAGYLDYFVGSPAVALPSQLYVGNDNYALYSLNKDTLELVQNPPYYSTMGIVCSSPAVSYASCGVERWLYVVTRSDFDRGDGAGTLLAFRTPAP